jgi:alpha-N-arabinofuranosidase
MPTQTIRIRGSHRLRNLLAPVAGAMLALALGSFALPDPITLTVRVNQPGPKIDPIFYGLMTEEINYSYDGGLYGELIRNRIFQDQPIVQGRRGGSTNPAGAQPCAQAAATTPSQIPAPMTSPRASNPAVAKNPNLIDWWLVASNGAAGDIDIDTKDFVNMIALKNSLWLDIKSAGAGRRVGVANDGYWGIPVKPNTTYTASFYARASQDFKGPLTVAIEGNNGTVYALGQVRALTHAWKKYTLKIKTGQVQATADARFVLSASNQGSLRFSLVSLFPRPTRTARTAIASTSWKSSPT